MRKLLLLVLVVFGIAGVLSAQDEGEEADDLIVIGPSEIGVVFDALTGELTEPLRPGTHELDPAQQVTVYDVALREFTMMEDDALTAFTADGQEVVVSVTVFYSIDRDAVNDLHLRWGDRFEDQFVPATLAAIVSQEVATFEASALYGRGLAELDALLDDVLGAEFAQENLQVSNVLIRELSFSEAFTEAIGESEIARLHLEQARFEADAVQIEAEAEAQVLSILSGPITENPLLLYVLYIRALGDDIDAVVVPGNAPFLFNLEALGDLDDIVLPEVGE